MVLANKIPRTFLRSLLRGMWDPVVISDIPKKRGTFPKSHDPSNAGALLNPVLVGHPHRVQSNSLAIRRRMSPKG